MVSICEIVTIHVVDFEARGGGVDELKFLSLFNTVGSIKGTLSRKIEFYEAKIDRKWVLFYFCMFLVA